MLNIIIIKMWGIAAVVIIGLLIQGTLVYPRSPGKCIERACVVLIPTGIAALSHSPRPEDTC